MSSFDLEAFLVVIIGILGGVALSSLIGVLVCGWRDPEGTRS